VNARRTVLLPQVLHQPSSGQSHPAFRCRRPCRANLSFTHSVRCCKLKSNAGKEKDKSTAVRLLRCVHVRLGCSRTPPASTHLAHTCNVGNVTGVCSARTPAAARQGQDRTARCWEGWAALDRALCLFRLIIFWKDEPCLVKERIRPTYEAYICCIDRAPYFLAIDADALIFIEVVC
jgi:hypothetical protein